MTKDGQKKRVALHLVHNTREQKQYRDIKQYRDERKRMLKAYRDSKEKKNELFVDKMGRLEWNIERSKPAPA
mgnify:CR=1 FL=1